MVAAVAVTALTVPLAPPAVAVDEAPRVQVRMQDPRITESSGLARSGYDDNILWTHNDAGDVARVFAVDDEGRTRAVLRLAGVKAVDFEAMARRRLPDGRSFLYVADIGDNARSRAEIVVHRLPEPRELRSGEVSVTSYRFAYPDGPHDAETLLVHPGTGRIHIVTKQWGGGDVYAAPRSLTTSGVNVLTRVGKAPSVVTDGTWLWGGGVVLRNYTHAFVSRHPGAPTTSFRLPRTAQGESIAPAPGNRGVLTGSEGSSSPVWLVPLPD